MKSRPTVLSQNGKNLSTCIVHSRHGGVDPLEFASRVVDLGQAVKHPLSDQGPEVRFGVIDPEREIHDGSPSP